jgi:hypothetical protein
VASKRSASCVCVCVCVFKAKIGAFVPFSAAYAYARRLMPVNRALKAARVPCALRSFCGSTGEAPPPPAASSALHLRRLCRVPWGDVFFIKLAFAYEATTQCSRTDRKPRSAHVTVLSALDSALAATAPPPHRPRPPPSLGVCVPRGGH